MSLIYTQIPNPTKIQTLPPPQTTSTPPPHQTNKSTPIHTPNTIPPKLNTKVPSHTQQIHITNSNSNNPKPNITPIAPKHQRDFEPSSTEHETRPNPPHTSNTKLFGSIDTFSFPPKNSTNATKHIRKGNDSTPIIPRITTSPQFGSPNNTSTKPKNQMYKPTNHSGNTQISPIGTTKPTNTSPIIINLIHEPETPHTTTQTFPPYNTVCANDLHTTQTNTQETNETKTIHNTKVASLQKKPSSKEHPIQTHHTELTIPPPTLTLQRNKNINTHPQYSTVTHKHHNIEAEIQTPNPSTHPTPLRHHTANEAITANGKETPHAITNKGRDSDSKTDSQHETSTECNSKSNTVSQRKSNEKSNTELNTLVAHKTNKAHISYRDADELEPLLDHIQSLFHEIKPIQGTPNFTLYETIQTNAKEVDRQRNISIKNIKTQCSLINSEEARSYMMQCFRITELDQYKERIKDHNKNVQTLINDIQNNPSPIQKLPHIPYPPNTTNDTQLNILLLNEYITKLQKHHTTLQNMTHVTNTLEEYTSALTETEKTKFIKKTFQWLKHIKEQQKITNDYIKENISNRDNEINILNKAKLKRATHIR